MIGQASFGNPWVFSPEPPVDFSEKVAVIKRHARYLIADKGEKKGCLEIRKHLVKYVRMVPGASAFRQQLVRVTSLTEIETLLDAVLTSVLEGD